MWFVLSSLRCAQRWVLAGYAGCRVGLGASLFGDTVGIEGVTHNLYGESMDAISENTCTETSLGGYIDLLNPEPFMVDIRDIATGLSKMCRFNGQCRGFYGVAQHSVLVSHLVPPEQALEGLMHDAAEAYLGDIVAPFKANADIPGYLAAEAAMQAVIARRFDLGSVDTPEIKLADLRILAAERRDLMPGSRLSWSCLDGIEPADVEVVPVGHEEAEQIFLARFYELVDARAPF